MGIIKTQQEFIGNSKRSGIPKGLQRISFCDYLRNFYSVKQIEIEPSSFNGYQKILENHIYENYPDIKYVFSNYLNGSKKLMYHIFICKLF